MSMLRNGIFAMILLLPSGCMMMDVRTPHGAAREATPAGATASTGSAAEATDTSQSAASVADKEQGTQREHDAPHAGYPSGMVILGGALMVVMMLAMLL